MNLYADVAAAQLTNRSDFQPVSLYEAARGLGLKIDVSETKVIGF